jgi:hypothetical protein
MFAELSQLWKGELPFSRAFWIFVVVYGLALNLSLSALALAAYAITGSIVVLLGLHFVPVPYNFWSFVGAWRSAGKLNAAEWHAKLARTVSLATFLALLLM